MTPSRHHRKKNFRSSPSIIVQAQPLCFIVNNLLSPPLKPSRQQLYRSRQLFFLSHSYLQQHNSLPFKKIR
ncbi:hypothetical protein HanRHA438_Chr17g0836081 [Helianthus annuus]|nr:hypothetical protein HanRHA438_Chr17g0836081 [Helianthus annuus]